MIAKKYLLLLLLGFPLTVLSQKTFKAGIIAGISTSQYDGDTYYGYHKIGLTGGGFVRTQLNDKWSLQFEIAYVQKGARKNYNSKSWTEYKLFLNYIEVPVIARLNFRSFVIEGNLGFGALIYQREIYNGLDVTGNRPFDKTEITFGCGISYMLSKNWDVNWRFTYSLLPVRPYQSGAVHNFRRGECNNVFAYSLRYNFGKDE